MLVGTLKRTLEISDSVAGLKVQKSVGVEGKCGDTIVESADIERRSSDILSVKKEAKRSTRVRSGGWLDLR